MVAAAALVAVATAAAIMKTAAGLMFTVNYVSGVVRSIDYQNRLVILRNKIAINIDLIKSIKIVN